MKSNPLITYPIPHCLAFCYSRVKNSNPNDEFETLKRTKRNILWLSLSLTVLSIILIGSVLAFMQIRKGDQETKKDEGELLLLMVPGGVSFMGIILVSVNLGETLTNRIKAIRRLDEFTRHYERFMAVIDATDSEIQVWSEGHIRQACVDRLEEDRVKVDAMKTSRGKLSKLARFIETYTPMIEIGLQFESVDSYIRYIRTITKPKPRKSRSKPKTVKKTQTTVAEPAA